MKTKLCQLIFFMSLIIFLNNCSKEECLDCNTYNMDDFNGDLTNPKDVFYICENDDLWDYIIWGNSNDIGGNIALIDLTKYQTGYRSVQDDDIDNDGILNDSDNDIDGDGLLNNADVSPNGFENNHILELVICERN